MTERETFFINDRPIMVYECRRPSTTAFNDPDGLPAQPTDAEIRIYNTTNGDFVEVDGSDVIGLGPEGSALYMTEMDETEDRGALLYVKLPDEMASVSGNYTVYITTVYADGLRITHDQRVQIAEYR
jgi:hypothetical protein